MLAAWMKLQGGLLFLSSAPLVITLFISTIPVLSDDRLLSGWCHIVFCLQQGQRGQGRAGIMLSAWKMCEGMQTKHSTSVDKTQPCSLGEVLLSKAEAQGLGRLSVSCQGPHELWCRSIQKNIYLYLLACVSLSQNGFIVSVTPSILGEGTTCHFTTLYRFIFQLVVATKHSSNDNMHKLFNEKCSMI